MANVFIVTEVQISEGKYFLKRDGSENNPKDYNRIMTLHYEVILYYM